MTSREFRSAVICSLLLPAALLSAPAPTPARPTPVVSVNDASVAELMTVPGVTRAVAMRLIAHRPYQTIDQAIVAADLPLETVRVAHRRFSLVPTALPPPEAPGGPATRPAVDVNHATAKVLMRELDVDAATAGRIVASRPFRTQSEFIAAAKLPFARVNQLMGRIAIEDTAPRPTNPTPPRTLPPSRTPSEAGGRLDVNTASPQELIDICRIAPMAAHRIVAGRPYRSLREVGERSGLPMETLRELTRCLKISVSEPPK